MNPSIHSARPVALWQRQISMSDSLRPCPTRGSAFTLVEIALSLAIVGFAMVAIIGVMPIGMTVQKENREETLISQDGLFLLEAIRSGSRGIDDLTNYVDFISVATTTYQVRNNRPINQRTIRYANDPSFGRDAPLTNAHHIVRLLTIPKYRAVSIDTVESNAVVAYVRGLSGVAAEKSTNRSLKNFTFRYEVRSEVIPFVNYSSADAQPNFLQARQAANLTNNLYEMRLTLTWPLYERSKGDWQVGFNRRTLRTLMAGSIDPTNALFSPNHYTARF